MNAIRRTFREKKSILEPNRWDVRKLTVGGENWQQLRGKNWSQLDQELNARVWIPPTQVEVGRARAKSQIFHLFSKAQAWLKPDLFREFFKLEKTRVQSTKPEPNLNPKKSGPTHLYHQGVYLYMILKKFSAEITLTLPTYFVVLCLFAWVKIYAPKYK
jgi:hypothetical protein